MDEITREQIEELRGLLTKATKGPWSTHLVDDTTIISPEREVATTCDSSQTEREDGYNIEYEQMEIDAALIVTMRNALPALLDIAETAIRNLEQSKGGEENVAGIPGNATSPGVTAGASETEELCKRLERIIAGRPETLDNDLPTNPDGHEAATLIRRLVAERDDAHAEAYTTDEDGQSVTWRELCEAERSIRQFQQRRATDAEAEVERLRAERDALRATVLRMEEDGMTPATKASIIDLELVSAVEQKAHEIYNSWAYQDGWVPWVECGNSSKQEDARRIARTALEGKSDG